ncbi:MAG: CoA transferase [Actinobacteria bacterium]|nr:CoA transferase [Actinomycetota bacterium]
MGPLSGYRVIEIAGQGPGPFAAMMLSDMGAEVLRIDRIEHAPVVEGKDGPVDAILNRGRRSVAVDLKNPAGTALLMELVAKADALIEGFRPGVAERLGFGPTECADRNERLVYGRITGWGQDGPLAAAPGHDINYIALSGVLAAIGEAGCPPVPPLNIVGDFGGGGMLLAFGVVCALLEARQTGKGQVVDAAMLDGISLLGALLFGMRGQGAWSAERGTNLLDGGAPFYGVYETADAGWVSVGAVEPKFFANLMDELEISPADRGEQMDRSNWPRLRELVAAAIRRRTRDEWSAHLQEKEICFAPVLDADEVPLHPHVSARGTFVEQFDTVQPAPAPRFTRTPGAIAGPPPAPGEHTEEALGDWGIGQTELAHLRESGAIGAAPAVRP